MYLLIINRLSEKRNVSSCRKSQVCGECYWRILGTLAKVANRIPRWDATEGILWGNLMACPAWKVGLATCTASPWPSRRFHDGKRFAGSLSGITERMIRVSEIHCFTGEPKYVCWSLSQHELQKVLQMMECLLHQYYVSSAYSASCILGMSMELHCL